MCIFRFKYSIVLVTFCPKDLWCVVSCDVYKKKEPCFENTVFLGYFFSILDVVILEEMSLPCLSMYNKTQFCITMRLSITKGHTHKESFFSILPHKSITYGLTTCWAKIYLIST